MDGSRVKLDRMVSIAEISGVQYILDVAFGALSSPLDMGVRPRFLSNFDAFAGMSRRASIFNSKGDSMLREWGYVRDTKGCLAAILQMTEEELDLCL